MERRFGPSLQCFKVTRVANYASAASATAKAVELSQQHPECEFRVYCDEELYRRPWVLQRRSPAPAKSPDTAGHCELS